MSQTLSAIDRNAIFNNIQAFFAGVSLIGFLLFLGISLQSGTPTVTKLGEWKLSLFAAFLGISLGYYFGKASRGGVSPAISFVIGILTTLVGIVVYDARLSHQTWVLSLGLVTVFLGYNSGLLREHTELEQWTERIKLTSWIGLVAILLIQYGIPILIEFTNWLNEQFINIIDTLANWSNQKLSILIIILAIILIGGFFAFRALSKIELDF
jgi:hypothetical protein